MDIKKRAQKTRSSHSDARDSPTLCWTRHRTSARSGPRDQRGGNRIEHRNHQERRNKVTLLGLVQGFAKVEEV
ncbi:hypothetical protein H920_05338 [Fukomys damarensis]|uniref:Uncharacterized protein n=1 Tax=Fukomys damarensis TaxID=885580 RepID=A0A091DSB7_FUKDA|nr:hypothetical protein H920_05338 [Fukomys damarensis]